MKIIQEIAYTPNKAAWIGFFVGPALLIFCIFSPPPAGMSQEAWLTIGMTLLMATWWATEAIPIPATSLLPIVLIPLLGINSLGKATAPYANSTIFLFLGGFVIGLALERWNLHKRIALMTLLAVGNHPRAQVAGFMITTAVISMWVSNTATAIMMLPIGLSVIDMLTSDKDDPKERERFATALLLGIAYAASIGGIATLIGTPPNALLAGFLSENYQIEIGFGRWMLLGLPVSAIMLVLAWWWLTVRNFKISGASTEELFKNELKALGPISRPEKMVGVIFLSASFCWIFQPLIAKVVPGINDTTIAICAAMALFVIPADPKNRVFLIDWECASKLPWGVLLLFGGGLSLAAAIGSSGLSSWIASSVGGVVGGMSPLVMMLIVVTVIMFLTEVTSNTATAATFLPLMAALAISQDLSPMMLAIPTAITASCAFMMPVATPPNAIVFGTGRMPITSMIRNGCFLSVIGIFIVTFLCYALIGSIWSLTS